MKKNVLALSIAAMIGGLGFAGAASAAVISGTTGLLGAPTATVLEIAEGGVGHQLLVPYYTVQNGNMSVFHVVNTDTVDGKAVKVRFRGAANSDDVMDFQVYLSPGDVWTAALTRGDNGVTEIVTNDNTCTVPALTPGVKQTFFTNRLNPALSDADKAEQTREGYVEIFNMADIRPSSVSTSLYAAIKHVNNVAPCSVAGSTARNLLNTIATTNYTDETTAYNAGFTAPKGGLMGDWYIINVPQTTVFSGGDTAVVAKIAPNSSIAGVGKFVHFPQSDTAVLGDINAFTADPLLRTDAVYGALDTPIGAARVTAGNYDLPDMSTPYLAGAGTAVDQARALSNALAVNSVTNQYANDVSITAKTDWVFSMPTRRYNVAANYNAATTTDQYRLFTTGVGRRFNYENTSVGQFGTICVNADSQRFFNREETTAGAFAPGPVFSPNVPGVTPVVRFCGEASVLSFADADVSVLGASNKLGRQNLVSGTYENGWGVINTTNAGQGLPIVGASFIKLSNPAARAGTSGTYGITWPHRFVKNIAP